MSRLLLVRHGITEFNSSRRFAGHTDIDISDEGVKQAKKLQERLADEKIDAVYSSDLQRAISTARIVSQGHGTEMSTCLELREINYGQVEGLTFQEISERHPDVADSIVNFSLDISFPGGEDFRGFINRTCKFLGRLDDHSEDETLLIVTHGGALKTLICEILSIGHEHWRKFRFDNASLTIVDIYSRGPILSLLNDTSHLKEPC